jgi:predicted DNA-binding ribbon-helix-helix protein
VGDGDNNKKHRKWLVRNGIPLAEGEQAWFQFKTVKSRLLMLEDVSVDMLEPRPKSIRLDGMSTCVRLEGLYWAILRTMADCNRITANALLTDLDREVQMHRGGVKNFSSLIRVMSTAHLLQMCPEGVRKRIMENIA